MKAILARLWKEEEGQDLTEYALLLVLVALAAIGSLGTLASCDQRRIHERPAANVNTLVAIPRRTTAARTSGKFGSRGTAT